MFFVVFLFFFLFFLLLFFCFLLFFFLFFFVFYFKECSTQVAATSKCAIPILHRFLGSGSHFAKLNAWSAHDNYLDWYGAEPAQGTYQGLLAEGTPAVWTTNKADAGHSDLNR